MLSQIVTVRAPSMRSHIGGFAATMKRRVSETAKRAKRKPTDIGKAARKQSRTSAKMCALSWRILLS